MAAHASLCSVRVGRHAEEALLADLLASVSTTGNGHLVFVSGDAGVGKSRLVAEVMELAGAEGLLTLVGECAPNAAIAYAPFVHAIRRGTRNLPTDQLLATFEGSAMLAAALLPEVATVIALPSTNPAPEDLSAAVWHLLAGLYRPRGGVLLLEDVHWADQDSLRMLTDLAGELADLPVLVVATYRSDEMHRRHPLLPVLSRLDRERRSSQISLQPLSREDVRTMLTCMFDGTAVGDDFTDLVLERTGGNPFFVEELTKVLIERGDIYQGPHDWERRDLAEIEMPVTVRETLLARARSLSTDGLAVLQLAALAADRLDPDVLAEASGLGLETIEEIIRQGLSLQLLIEVREGVTTAYVFRHALTREAFADELVGPDRRRAHERLAKAIVSLHGRELDSYAAELADHFEAGHDNEAAMDFALRAARCAASSYARDEADHRFDQALRMMPSNDAGRLPLLLEAAGWTTSAGVSAMRVAFATDLRTRAAEQGDPVAEARALLVLEGARWQVGDGPGAIALAREALRLVQGRDDSVEAWVLHRLSRLLRLGDKVRESEEPLARGIELACAAGNDSALSGLYGTQMMTVSYGPAFVEAREAALTSARAAGDLDAELNLSTNNGFISLWCGDLADSRDAFERARALALRIAPNDRYVDAGYAWLLSLTGEYVRAQELARPVLTYHRLPSRVVALTALCEIAERRGDSDLGDLVADMVNAGMATAESQRSVPALSVQARLALANQGVEAAAPLFWEALRTTAAGEVHGSHWSFSPDLARALADEGSEEALAEWVRAVGELTTRDPNPHNMVADLLCRGYLELVHADLGTARRLFREAGDHYRSMPGPARYVECLLGLALVEIAAGHLPEAAVVAREAVGVAERCGASTLVARGRLLLDRSEAQPILATILVTDIIGSTERAAALGDLAWTELLERHHAIVRRELARARGREIDTAGDGFLAAFSLPAQAIRCAVAIRDSLAAVGIHIRAGLHTGECYESGGKLTGITVHIAARVASVGVADEVLVSGTVRELVAGSGMSFEPRGTHALKGVPGEWRLFAVTR